MNNLFVDAHFGGETPRSMGGQDADRMPMGIHAIDFYRATDTLKPAGYPAEDKRINYIMFNANYITPELKAYWKSMPDTFYVANYEKGDNGFLNDRSWKMMKGQDGFNYPYFIWDDQKSVYTENPQFKGYTVKVEDQIEISKQMNGFAANVKTENGTWGRYPEADGNASYPIARNFYDFSYTNTKYLTAGYAGYPLGDLNWFPEKKAQWDVDPNRETYEKIINSIIFASNREFTAPATFSVFPNPVSDKILNIRGVENEIKHVYNITGQTLIITRDNQIDVSGLKSGIYLIRVGESVQKFSVK
jgi:hypothetical protein